MKNIKFYKENNIILTTPLFKGWSGDKKYILERDDGEKFLLRISNSSVYEKRKQQFMLLQKLNQLNINCSKPIEIGLLENGDVYMILSYLEGIEGSIKVKDMTNEMAYNLGKDAGEILKKIHSLEVSSEEKPWFEKYQEKMTRKLKVLENSKYKLKSKDIVVEFYKNNIDLMKNRTQVFSHGDYHLGNMIVDKNDKLGIIDFDKHGIHDPYDEFKSCFWSVKINEYFATGQINAYFDNNIPDDFFKILKFYVAENIISQLPWSATFGEDEIKTAYEMEELQLKWYNNFELDVPTWYKGIL